MLKVLHLLPMNKLSGAERMGLLICKHMTDVKSHVITGGANLASEFEKEGIQVSHVNFSIRQLPKVIKELNKYIKEKEIDIIHAHDNIASLCAYLTRKRYRLNVKVVSHIHSCYPWLEGNSIYKKIDQWARPKYDYNIACGNIVNSYYNKHARYFNNTKNSILSNAIDMSQLDKIPKKNIDSIREEFNIPNNQTIIGYIGRLIELKGLIPFIKELKNYKNQFKDCKFLIVGDGEQQPEIKQLVTELNLEDLFIFTGFQSDVYPFYQLIDIFFLPSLYEGLPMVLLEAGGSGVPIISMNVGSVSEVIENEISGILIEPENYDEFLKKLILLKDSEEFRKELSHNSISYIASNYSINSYNNSLKEIYKIVYEN